jgi:hypothetical protein
MDSNLKARLTRLRHATSVIAAIRFGAAAVAAGPLSGSDANARDLGQWKNNDPQVSQWFRALAQPDTYPPISCCGEADAYWADKVEIGSHGETIAVVTDDRDDQPLMRMHENIGSRYVVPPNKITRKDGNPTGHVLIFLGAAEWLDGQRQRPVLCYVMNPSV